MTNKLGFSAEYAESISPVERVMYIKYFMKEQQEKEKKRKEGGKNKGPSLGSPIEV